MDRASIALRKAGEWWPLEQQFVGLSLVHIRLALDRVSLLIALLGAQRVRE